MLVQVLYILITLHSSQLLSPPSRPESIEMLSNDLRCGATHESTYMTRSESHIEARN